MNKLYLDKEYDKIFAKICNGDNITLLRYGDGERSIMTGKAVKAQEGWESPNTLTELGKALLDTLTLQEENVYYGISCPCCDSQAYYWYRSRIVNENITFANLFVNINYRRFKDDFYKVERDAVVIANYKGKGKRIGNLNILDYFSVSDSCQDFWNNGEAEKLINKVIQMYGEKNDILYVVSAGPLSEPIIFNLYKNNPNNCYIDFGSSIDSFIHGSDTRPYTNPKSIFGSRNCYMHDCKRSEFDVSVVLTTYKKPDALEKQLSAIKNQSLKPKEIFLFQDGISNPYRIIFNEEIIKEFTEINISESNKGVWERFRYAKDSCSSKYVCLFDDDTIPGERWLENCLSNMFEQEGVYGTVGIMMQNYKKYPYSGFTRVGWHNPYHNSAQVDFVGHSWFVKREYLDYMFDNTEEYQKYKLAAEDMCLSFKCKEHGVNTYVPPHPYYDFSYWGSLPEYGLKFGQASTAISQNPTGCKLMREALEKFVSNGWAFIYDENPRLIKKQVNGAKIDHVKSLVKTFIKKVKRKLKIDVQ